MFYLRPSKASDYNDLVRLHKARGAKFPLPSKLSEVVVACDEQTDAVIGIVGSRETREEYLWIDPTWATPRWRWEMFYAAHEDMRHQLEEKGVEDVFVFLEPSTGTAFGRHLERKLGWKKSLWACFTRKVKNNA